LLALTLIASIFLPIGLRYLLDEILSPILFGCSNYNDKFTFLDYFRDNLYYSFRYSFLGGLYFFLRLSFYNTKKEKDIHIENQKTQLSLLRTQINPHFLLNSINNIYSLVYHKSENSLHAIDLLSDVLKYSLYEKRERVTIAEEYSQILKFIELHKLRLDYQPALLMSIDENAKGVQIAPMLIIPLIENAFKHGMLKSQDNPVKFSIFKKENHLYIEQENMKRGGSKDQKGGVGLENIKKRLELIYQGKHDFHKVEDEHHFKIKIKIEL